MRLTEGYLCFIDGVVLSSLTKDHKGDPRELTRRLFTAIIGEEALAQSSVGGGGKHPAIDADVREAIKGMLT